MYFTDYHTSILGKSNRQENVKVNIVNYLICEDKSIISHFNAGFGYDNRHNSVGVCTKQNSLKWGCLQSVERQCKLGIFKAFPMLPFGISIFCLFAAKCESFENPRRRISSLIPVIISFFTSSK